MINQLEAEEFLRRLLQRFIDENRAMIVEEPFAYSNIAHLKSTFATWVDDSITKEDNRS